MTKRVTFMGELLTLAVGACYSNGRMALELRAADGESFAVASVNLPDHECPAGEVYIKDYSENRGIAAALIEAGVLYPDPTETVHSGFVTINRYRIKELA